MTKIADLKTFDVSDYLDSEEKIAEYLAVVLEDNDPTLLAAALGDVARARGMAQPARDTRLAREGLYRSLCATGQPSYATIVKVMQALGLKLVPQPLTR